MVAAVRMAGQTADIHRDRTAAVRTGVRVAVARIEAALLPTVDLAAAGNIVAVAVPLLADPAAVAVEDIAEEVVVVRAEEAVALHIRLRHAVVAAEDPTSKSIGLWASPSPSPSVPRVSVRRLRRD